MASEPVNVFAATVAPAGVRDAVLARHPSAAVEADGDTWRSITVRFGRGDSARTLTLLHDPDYYAGPGWPTQTAGMAGYFRRFPDPAGRLPRVTAAISTFRFALAFRFDPDYDDPATDERFAVVCGVARLLDGVLFTPSGLRDAAGRLLFGADGRFDPDAEWPAAAPPAADRVDRPAPPTAERVARRAAALAAVTGRAVVEREARGGAADADAMLARVRGWADALALADELEPAERDLLAAPPGSLPVQAFVDAMWRIEGLAVLGWAVGRLPPPRYDETVNIDAVWGPLGFPNPAAARGWLAAPTLRPADELEAYRKQVLAFHWRLRDFRYVRAERMDFRAFAGRAWFGPFDVTAFDLIDDELAIAGERLDRASADAVGTALSIAHERHLAINWLCVGPAAYSETYVGT
jgi:hypothetical protein